MRRISDKRLVISDKRRNADIAHVPYYFSFLCALCCLLLLWGCDRRDITYYTEAEFSIRVDWSNSRLDAEESGYGATAVFYPQDGSFPITVLMGDRNSERVRLHTGRYDVIVFNRSFTDFGSLAFRGEGFRGLEAYSRDVETRTDPVTRTETRVIVSSPEKLASGVTEGFEVSEEMLGNYSAPSSSHSRSGMSSGTGSDDYTLSFAPLCLTREVKVQINVTGLNNIRSAVGILTGVSESVNLSTGKASGETVSQQFTLDDIRFTDGSPFNGTLTGVFNAFGFDTAISHKLTVKALLVDGKTVFEETFDITAHELEDETGTLLLYIEVAAPPIPDVKPEGGADSGFDADVDDWGDEEENELPM